MIENFWKAHVIIFTAWLICSKYADFGCKALKAIERARGFGSRSGSDEGSG